MNVSVQLTAEDYIDARKLSLRPRKGMRITLYVLLCLYAVALASMVYQWLFEGQCATTLAWLIAAPAYFAFLYCVILPWRTRQLFKQHTLLHDLNHWEFADDSIHVSSERGHAKINWSDFHKWKANDKVVLLYQSSLVFNMFPRRAFACDADYQTFSELAKRHLGKQKP